MASGSASATTAVHSQHSNMDHPLIGSLKELTNEEVSAKISELSKKLNYARRSNNNYLCNQIIMALNTFMTEQQVRSSKNKDTPFNEVIDIS